MIERFIFIRHGETAHNRNGLRCGGDLDIPLTDTGEQQARAAGVRLAQDHPGIDVIFASPLHRTRRTAALVAESLAAPTILIHPGLVERRLGSWNGRTVEETQADLSAGRTPPGGEAEADFRRRIAAALKDILDQEYRLPLLVGSKGVARIISLLLLGEEGAPPLANTGLLEIGMDPAKWYRLSAALA